MSLCVWLSQHFARKIEASMFSGHKGFVVGNKSFTGLFEDLEKWKVGNWGEEDWHWKSQPEVTVQVGLWNTPGSDCKILRTSEECPAMSRWSSDTDCSQIWSHSESHLLKNLAAFTCRGCSSSFFPLPNFKRFPRWVEDS